jgi:hypothetical protein
MYIMCDIYEWGGMVWTGFVWLRVRISGEFAGSNPAEAVGFFGHPKNPQYAFLRSGSKII